MKRTFSALLILVVASSADAKEPAKQYEFKDLVVSAATADEAKRDQVSVEKAVDYLEKGTLAWSKSKKCVSCHTNGSYMLIRPELTKRLGKPSAAMRQFFVEEVDRLTKVDKKRLLTSTFPTRVAYVAAGLASWDRHVSKSLSADTEKAIALMLSIQSEDGAWGNLDCWPPLESSRYHGATVAAMGMAMAPGWLQQKATEAQKKKFASLKSYLRTTAPANDYQRLLLLWTSNHVPDLLTSDEREELVAMVLKHQLPDGGWSLRTFSTPEKWGGGNRAKKLRGRTRFCQTAQRRPPNRPGLDRTARCRFGCQSSPAAARGRLVAEEPTGQRTLVDPLAEHRSLPLYYLLGHHLSASSPGKTWQIAKMTAGTRGGRQTGIAIDATRYRMALSLLGALPQEAILLIHNHRSQIR